MTKVNIVRVRRDSRPSAVGAFISAQFVNQGQRSTIEVRAIGDQAISNAVVATAMAIGFAADDGVHLACKPVLIVVTEAGQERQGLSILVDPE
ncbi:MAG TPA: stage V sporulation protein S [Symbiobacteriaceae bacterium]|nr:stage V sporulation protein S [Symbiobacteriaceae bacterium]